MKNFEAGHSTPTANNLSAIQSSLEFAGIDFVPEEHGGPGVLIRRLRPRGYIPGEGLHLEAHCVDFFLDAPDNDYAVWFRISEAALVQLAGRSVANEDDAKIVVRTHNGKLINVVKAYFKKNGLSSLGGRAREITPADIGAANKSSETSL